MSPTSPAGACRVTVVAAHRRVDLALPQDIALADLYPEILRLTGERPAAGRPPGWHLVRLDGRLLDSSLTLEDQSVLDGEVLAFRPYTAFQPPVVHDDVAEAVAAASAEPRRRPIEPAMAARWAMTALCALMAVALWGADPVHHAVHGLPGAVAGASGILLAVWAAAGARVRLHPATASAAGLAALPLLLVAGAAILPPGRGEGPGRLELLLGCVTVLVVATLLTVLAPSPAPFLAAACAAATGSLAAFAAVLTSAPPDRPAAVCAVAGIAVVAFLPALSVRFARVPVGYDPRLEAADLPDDADAGDARDVAPRVRRAHELLLALVGGASAVILVSAVLLAFSGSGWAWLLCAATGLAAVSRARLFRHRAPAICLVVAGCGAIIALVLGLAVGPAAPGGILPAVVLAAAAASLAVTARGGRRSGSPSARPRLLELAETALLLSLVPLCLAVLHVYAAARGMTSGQPLVLWVTARRAAGPPLSVEDP